MYNNLKIIYISKLEEFGLPIIAVRILQFDLYLQVGIFLRIH